MESFDKDELIREVEARMLGRAESVRSSLSWKKLCLWGLAILVLGFGLGFAANHMWQVSDLRAQLARTQGELASEKKKDPVKVPYEVRVEGKSTLAYVDRPVYIDPSTGKTVIDRDTGQPKLDEADLKYTADLGKKDFKLGVIGYDGKRHDFTFDKKIDEKYMFDKGQLQWDTTWTMNATVDMREMMDEYAKAKVDVERRRPDVGLYGTNNGVAIGLSAGNTKGVRFNAIVGVPDPGRIWGIGVSGKI